MLVIVDCAKVMYIVLLGAVMYLFSFECKALKLARSAQQDGQVLALCAPLDLCQ